jgi:hypothetical protein
MMATFILMRIQKQLNQSKNHIKTEYFPSSALQIKTDYYISTVSFISISHLWNKTNQNCLHQYSSEYNKNHCESHQFHHFYQAFSLKTSPLCIHHFKLGICKSSKQSFLMCFYNIQKKNQRKEETDRKKIHIAYNLNYSDV